MTSPAKPRLSPITLLRVFTPFALGYFLSYTYRTVNAVIAPDLVADIGLNANSLGLLTSAYFLSFAAFQIPLGILLDHYGPRRVEAVLLLFAALGAALFAMAENIPGLIIARGLIGFGVSACLMASFKAYVMWFPKEKLALINGFQMMAGGLGAMAATRPIETLLGITDWRGVFWLLAVVTFVVALMIFFIVPDGKHKEGNTTLKDALKGVSDVFSSPLFWRVAPVTIISQASYMAVHGLWSGPWLGDVAGFEREQVASSLFFIAGAMIGGFFFWGLASERLQKLYNVKPMNVALAGMVGFMVMQLLLIMQAADFALPVWLAFAFFGTAGILPYAALSQSFPHHLAGRVNTGLNLLVFVLAFGGQWATGVVIDIYPPTPSGGYSPDGYSLAFAVLLSFQVMAFIWYIIYQKRGNTQ